MTDEEKLCEAIFGRIRSEFGHRSDAEMARFLGIHPQDVPRMRRTGNPPFRAITAKVPPEHLAYILTGIRPEASPTDLESAITRIRNAGGTVSFPPKQ